MTQTAVEWLFKWMIDNKDSIIEERLQAFEQAKELEKQQIANAFVDGRNVGSKDHPGVDGNYYYEQVYK
jgi:hypothetical protein